MPLLHCVQGRRICPRFAHLRSVGIEVVHVRAESHSRVLSMWSPDGETLASFTADPTSGRLLVTCVASGRLMTAVLPASSVLGKTTFWSPNSELIVSITSAHAYFVDRQTCTVRLQQTSLPQQPGVHRALCGRAGLIVVAQLGEQQGMFSICSLVGTPKKLAVLRQISTGRAQLSLALSHNGLMLAWADCGSCLQPLQPIRPEGFLVQGRPRVHICELATGRCAMLCRTVEVATEWQPRPTTQECFLAGENADLGVRLLWNPSGTAIHILSMHSPPDFFRVPVQRVCLLP